MSDRDRKRASENTRRSYDALAREYARNISGELEHRPRERELLQRFAARCSNQGLICDLGCGPGHIAGYMAQFNPDVFGLDLSHGVLCEAQKANPATGFVQGDMLALPLASGTLAGIVGFYSIIHFDDVQLARALKEMERVLAPDGNLLLGFHAGTRVEHVEELWGIRVTLDARFFLTEDIIAQLENFGLTVLESFEREPHSEVEYQSVRGYIWAVKRIGP